MKLAIGSDESTHMTDMIIDDLKKAGHEVELFGPLSGKKELWPQVAKAVADCVASGAADEGILFCWTGTGVSIVANKVKGIRAALCGDAQTAKGARQWNHANILCMSLRATSNVIAQEIIDAWFGTPLGTDPLDLQCISSISEMEDAHGVQREK